MLAVTRRTLITALIAIAAASPALIAQEPAAETSADALKSIEETYQKALQERFVAGETLTALEQQSEAFLTRWAAQATPAQLATARTYRTRCWLSAERHADVMRETGELLSVGGLGDADRGKLLYYRGSSAIALDDRAVAEESAEKLFPLRAETAVALIGAIARKWTPVEPGKEPPAWTLQRIGEVPAGVSEALSLKDLRGKYVLLDFWATWCGPCRAVMESDLAPLHKQWKGDDRFELVSVGTNWRSDTAEKQATFAKEKEYHWTKVFDADGRVTARYGVAGIPTLTLIDPKGVVIAHGGAHQVLPVLKETLAKLEATGG
jgi:thiol-disulfide isomerase/thioredoxin